MLQHVPVPGDLHDWIESAAMIASPAELAQSQFPAMVASMLVVRLAGQVCLQDQPVPAAAWISASRAPRSFQHQGAVQALGLVLRPEAAVSLWPATRGLVDTVRPVTAVAGPAWRAVEIQIRSAATDDARLDALFQFVRYAAQSPGVDDRRQQVMALLHSACAPSAGTSGTSNAATVGRRQIERRFSALLGLSPKQFQLIARHNQTLRQAAADPQRPGAQLALDGDYCDQSHMTRDMRRFAGHPLRDLLGAPRPAHDEHWPLAVGAAATPTPDQPAPSSRKR